MSMPSDLPSDDDQAERGLRQTLPQFADQRDQVLERLRQTPGVHLPENVPDTKTSDPSTPDFQAEKDRQIREGGDILRGMEDLREDHWQTLDADQRLNVLNEVEARMAAAQGRPPVPVEMAPMASTEYGGYSRDQGQITLNSDHLSNDSMPSSEFADTIVHEGRHAYQDYAVQHPGFDADQKAVESWADNQQHYRDMQRYGPDLYREQPLEKDAWEYANRVVSVWKDN